MTGEVFRRAARASAQAFGAARIHLLGRFILTRSFIREGLWSGRDHHSGRRAIAQCFVASSEMSMFRRMLHHLIAVTLLISSAAVAAPKLVITEIMYDPTSPESDDQQTEWVEIQNAGAQTINLQG